MANVGSPTLTLGPGAALNGYEELLEPALMMHDVSFWVNYECPGDEKTDMGFHSGPTVMYNEWVISHVISYRTYFQR